jgi:hypothetical protein
VALSAYFRESPLEHIVSITIGLAAGAVVVMAQEIADIEGVAGSRYVGRPAQEPPPPQDWKLVSENDFSFRSMSLALVPNPAEPTSRGTPTYLLGTGWIETSAIHYSNDGEHWSVVHSLPMDGGNGFTGIVWHPTDNCFYACWQGNNDPGETEVFLRVRIFRSIDGRAWSLHQDFVAFSDDEAILVFDAATAAFRALCIKPENRGGIPDGVQGYDSTNLIFIRPRGLPEWDVQGIQAPAPIGIEIEVDGTPSAGGAGLPQAVFAVSFAGRIWNALVYDTSVPPFTIPTKVYMSADDGKNWVETFATTGFQPAGIVSGAVADVGEPT